MNNIYHITSRQAALLAQTLGEYRSDSLAQEGFIHFSQKHQVLNVANTFYTGQQDLVLLVVHPVLLKADLRYEAPVHPGTASASASIPEDQRFPHLYGPLNFDAVIQVLDLPRQGDRFVLPSSIV